jgi:multidrug efflux pump
MGLVIVSGLSFGSLVSLFVIPAFYVWFGQVVRKPESDLVGSPGVSVDTVSEMESGVG